MRLGFLVPLLLTGCATIFSSGEQTVAVRTSPPGAVVYVGNEKQDGVTPMDVTFEKTGDPIELRFEKEGFITEYYFIKKGWWWLQTIDWIFLIPGIVDQFFVRHVTYSHKTVLIHLREEGPRK